MCCIDHTKTLAAGAGGGTAIRSTSAQFRLECRYCGWGDHNTTWHEQMEEKAS
jgi:hypothetical protein